MPREHLKRAPCNYSLRSESPSVGKAGDLHILGFHALLWEAQENRYVHGLAQNGEETDGGEAASVKGSSASPDARVDGASRSVAEAGRPELLPIPRGSGQLGSTVACSNTGCGCCGEASCFVAVRRDASPGSGSIDCWTAGFLSLAFCTLIRWTVSTPFIQGKSPVH